MKNYNVNSYHVGKLIVLEIFFESCFASYTINEVKPYVSRSKAAFVYLFRSSQLDLQSLNALNRISFLVDYRN